MDESNFIAPSVPERTLVLGVYDNGVYYIKAGTTVRQVLEIAQAIYEQTLNTPLGQPHAEVSG
jgi:hypothetical protein